MVHVSREVLEIIPKITGGLSFLFSLATVTYILFFGEDANKRGFYNRLVIGMCCADMLSSMAFFFSTWPMPVDSPNAALAAGNEATCRIQGFFTQYSIASQLYVASIGTFYLLAVKYGWKEDHFAKWGPLFHLVPIGFGLGTSISATVLNVIGPADLWCWIAPQPDRPELDVNLYRMVFFYGPLWLAMFVVGVNLFFVFRYVNNVTKIAEGHVTKWMPEKSKRHITESAETTEEEDIYCGQGSSDSSEQEEEHDHHYDDDDDGDSSVASTEDVEDAEQDGRVSKIVRKKQEAQIKLYAKRRQEIAYQCLRFALAFYITWTPLSCVRILQLLGNPVPYGLLVLSAVMTPIQGLPNLLAFLYPMMRKRWKHYRKHPGPKKQDHPNNEKSKHNADHKPGLMEGSLDRSNPPPLVDYHKTKKSSDRRGIHGSSAWELSMMSEQHTYEFQLDDSSELESEEKLDNGTNIIYTHPELLMMGKRYKQPSNGSYEAKDLEPKCSMMASLTARLCDLDGGEGDAGRKPRSETSSKRPRYQFRSSLECNSQNLGAISELTESVFDPTMNHPSIQDSEGDCEVDPLENSEKRWISGTIAASPSTNCSKIGELVDGCRIDDLVAPRRMESKNEVDHQIDEKGEGINDANALGDSNEADDQNVRDTPYLSIPIRFMDSHLHASRTSNDGETVNGEWGDHVLFKIS